MQNCKSSFDHAVGADLDYGFTWKLLPNETISSSVWEMDATLSKRDEQLAGNVTSVFVSGLVEGNVYVITNHIETSMGREDSRSLTLSCKKRFP